MTKDLVTNCGKLPENNLSNKIVEAVPTSCNQILDMIPDFEVRDTIKLLRKEICCCEYLINKKCNNCEWIDKLFGSKLI